MMIDEQLEFLRGDTPEVINEKVLRADETVFDEIGFRQAFDLEKSESALTEALEKLGRLPSNFNGRVLLPLLQHRSVDVRLLAVKNLGKLKSDAFFERVRAFALNEQNTIVRREAVSAIGRMKTPQAIPILIYFLRDADPKIVLQAARALLPFKHEPHVWQALSELETHDNELVRDSIRKEIKAKDSIRVKDENHAINPDFLKNVFVCGDVREVLKHVPDESVHLTFTSPPYYNARDYMLYKSYDEYLQQLVSIFKQVHRITKEGRFFALNTSPVIVPRMSRSHSSKRYLIPFDIHPLLTEIGWEFIEDIVWIKPDPSVKNRNGGFFQHRKPLAYKANSVSEYIIVYRKHTDKLIDWNLQQYPEETISKSKVTGDYEKTNAWKIAPSNDKVHPATFPKNLAARVIEFYSMKGDLVFDPFAGTGTTGQAAIMLDRNFFLTEIDETYTQRAQQLLDVAKLGVKSQPSFYTLKEFAAATNKESE